MTFFLHSPTRRLVGLEAERPSGRRRFGLRCHVQQAPWSDFVEVHWSSHAEAYVTPVDDDLVGVAILTERGEGFDEALADFPVLRERLVGERTRVRGAGPKRRVRSSATRPVISSSRPGARASISVRRGLPWHRATAAS